MLNAKRKLEMAKASDQNELRQLLRHRKTGGPWRQAVGWYHRVGRLLNQLCPKNSPHDRGALPRLVAALDYRDSVKAKRIIQECYKFRDLAVTYPDVKVLMSFKYIRWGHLRILCSVPSQRQRQKLERLCEQQGFSCEALSLHVQVQRGHRLSQGRRSYHSRSLEPKAAVLELELHVRRMNDLLGNWISVDGLFNPKTIRTKTGSKKLENAHNNLLNLVSCQEQLLDNFSKSIARINRLINDQAE